MGLEELNRCGPELSIVQNVRQIPRIAPLKVRFLEPRRLRAMTMGATRFSPGDGAMPRELLPTAGSLTLPNDYAGGLIWSASSGATM